MFCPNKMDQMAKQGDRVEPSISFMRQYNQTLKAEVATPLSDLISLATL